MVKFLNKEKMKQIIFEIIQFSYGNKKYYRPKIADTKDILGGSIELLHCKI